MPRQPLTALRMSEELTARVDELAAAAGVSRSEQIRTMIEFADHKKCPAGWTRPKRAKAKV